MRVRAIDAQGDWLFGKGANDYLTRNAAVMQNIATRLRSILADCFFDLTAGIDWFNLLGAKDKRALSLAVSATILNTPEVTGLQQLSIALDAARNIAIKYQVTSIYSRFSGVSGEFTSNISQLG